MDTSYYGPQGGIAPVFSCGRVRLAPSFLTGNGSHLCLWVSILIHVAALATNMAANIAFIVNSYDNSGDILKGWAFCSLIFHTLAVLTVLITTGLFKNVVDKILVNTAIFGFLMAAMLATVLASYAHEVAQPANNVENVNYNLSMLFQALGVASILANAFAAMSANK